MAMMLIVLFLLMAVVMPMPMTRAGLKRREIHNHYRPSLFRSLGQTLERVCGTGKVVEAEADCDDVEGGKFGHVGSGIGICASIEGGRVGEQVAQDGVGGE